MENTPVSIKRIIIIYLVAVAIFCLNEWVSKKGDTKVDITIPEDAFVIEGYVVSKRWNEMWIGSISKLLAGNVWLDYF